MNYVGDGEDQLSGTEILNDFHLDSLKTLMIGGYGPVESSYLYCLQQKARNEPTKGNFVPKPLVRATHLSRLGLQMTRLDYVNLIYEQGHH